MSGNFSIEQYPIAYLRPQLAFPYAWVGHIPFAYVVVELLRPRRFVELGVDSGNSYFAFCQAIKHLGLPCEAFAVDTWRGDEHARFYGEEVYAAFLMHQRANYADFSRALRKSFDEALDDIEDGSIDLLHIDGLHTYEAVRHDFETWLPKLSERGVVLFHDSEVFDRGFGVWKFVDELSRRYDTFRFTHSNGLAVVAVGDDLPEPMRGFFARASEDPNAMRATFASIAAGVVTADGSRLVPRCTPRAEIVPRIYYRGENDLYAEDRILAAAPVSIDADARRYGFRFDLPATLRPHYVRIDPIDRQGVFRIEHIRLVADGGTSAHDFVSEDIVCHSGIALPEVAGALLAFASLDRDPWLELDVSAAVGRMPAESEASFELTVVCDALIVDDETSDTVRFADALRVAGHALPGRDADADGMNHTAGVVSASDVGHHRPDWLQEPSPPRSLRPKLYWRSEGDVFIEENSLDEEIPPSNGIMSVEFMLPTDIDIDVLRFDPDGAAGMYSLTSASFGGCDIDFERALRLANERRLPSAAGQVCTVSFGDDPFFEFDAKQLLPAIEARSGTLRLEFQRRPLASFVVQRIDDLEHRFNLAASADAAAFSAISASLQAIDTVDAIGAIGASVSDSAVAASEFYARFEAQIGRRAQIDDEMLSEMRALRQDSLAIQDRLERIDREQAVSKRWMERRSPRYWLRRMFGRVS